MSHKRAIKKLKWLYKKQYKQKQGYYWSQRAIDKTKKIADGWMKFFNG